MSYIVDAAIGVIDKSNVATRGWFRIEPRNAMLLPLTI